MDSPVPLVILDCDGVVVDSEHLLLDVRIEMLAEIGVELPRAELIERFVGTPNAEFVAEVERLTGSPLPAGWDADYRARSRAAFERSLAPVPGIVLALDALAADGIATCIASSGSHEKIAMTLGITGLLGRFDGRIFSGTEVAHGKPAPDLFLHAAARMGWAPSQCVVVEDSSAGVSAGVAAGMQVIAYAAGITPRSRLERPGVTLIDDMSDLPSTVELLTGS